MDSQAADLEACVPKFGGRMIHDGVEGLEFRAMGFEVSEEGFVVYL